MPIPGRFSLFTDLVLVALNLWLYARAESLQSAGFFIGLACFMSAIFGARLVLRMERTR